MDVKKIVHVTKEVLFLLLVTAYYCFMSLFRRVVPKPKKSLAGRYALVTGAGHGLGHQFALQLAGLGVKVICWDINSESCEKTAKEVREKGGEAWAFRCDVSDPHEIARVAKETRNAVRYKISLLFNNAGILKPCKPFIEQSPEEIQNIFRVNVYSQMYMVQEFYNDLLESGPGSSHIVSMCSIAAQVGAPNMSTYCATKFAINGFMDAFDSELRTLDLNRKMLTTIVYPFFINTGLAKNPRARFSCLTPIINPDQAVKTVLDGVRRNEKQIFIPRRLEFLFNIKHILPLALQPMLIDFLGCGVDRHEE